MKLVKGKIKEFLPVIFLIIGSVLLLAFFVYIGFQEGTVTHTEDKNNAKMQFALVNEDRGASFEEKNYGLGADFVTVINQDSTNRWETTTRNIAHSGVENGQFDAEIIIPQDFSERLLSLESINPEKALIEYRVREGQNEVSNQAIQEKVNTILKDFNERIVQMYFSSIIGSLSEAQQNVNQIVGIEVKQKNELEQKIYTPFKELPSNYTNVLSTTSLLEETNKIFTQDQAAFVDSVKNLMDSNNQSLESSSQTTKEVQSTVTEYTEEANDKLKTSIEQFNDQFELHKKQLAAQWEDDLTGYQNQYDQLNDTLMTQFNNFYSKGSKDTESTGVYSDFLLNAYAFQESQATRIDELKEEIADLTDRVTQLTELKAQIAKTYFNDENTTPDSVTQEQVKQAIIQQISGTQNEAALVPEYLQSITDKLRSISFLDQQKFDELLVLLKDKQLLNNETMEELKNSYQIINKYDPELDKQGQFAILTPDDQTTEAQFDISSTVNLTVDKLPSSQTINLATNTDGRGSIAVQNLTDIANDLQRKIASYINNSDVAVTVSKDEVTNLLTIDIGSISGELEKLPNALNLTYKIYANAVWTIENGTGADEYLTCPYAWKLNGNDISHGSFSVYSDKDQPLKNDLAQLFELFTSINTNANQLAMIYGNPSALDVTSLVKAINENPDKPLSELADKSSIYWMYNNLTDQKKEVQISDSLCQKYKESGTKIYTDTKTQIERLQAIIGTAEDQNQEGTPTLYGTLNLMTTPEQLIQEANVLGTWFEESVKQIDQTYQTWHETDKVNAESVITPENEHPEESDTKMIASSTEGLVETLQSLVKSSKEIAASTEQSAAKVTDIAPTIKEIKETTDTVQTNAKDILSSLDLSVEENKKTVKTNKNYAKNFEKVLANTKNGGADNPAVFNFLSNPISGMGQFGKTRQVSLIPYYATVIGAILMIVVSMALQGYTRSRVVSTDDLLLQPTRTWQNVPNVFLIVLTSVLLSIAFATALAVSVTNSSKFAWFSYSFLVFLGGSLCLIGFMRQFKRITLYVCGGILGLFFMLTPLLGVSTKNGSLIHILYRISPLQNIQNGFTALLNGVSIGWVSLLVLVVIIGFGIFLNFIVRPEETLSDSKKANE